jgi:hypothetical protein
MPHSFNVDVKFATCFFTSIIGILVYMLTVSNEQSFVFVSILMLLKGIGLSY